MIGTGHRKLNHVVTTVKNQEMYNCGPKFSLGIYLLGMLGTPLQFTSAVSPTI
jgi:hypothetical protein